MQERKAYVRYTVIKNLTELIKWMDMIRKILSYTCVSSTHVYAAVDKFLLHSIPQFYSVDILSKVIKINWKVTKTYLNL